MTVAETEKAFAVTTRLLLGEELSPIDAYGEWLGRHLGKRNPARSPLSGDLVPMREQYRFLRMVPTERIISFNDGETTARGMKMEGVGSGSGLGELVRKVPKIAYFNLDERTGRDINNEEVMGIEDTVSCYRTNDAFESKNVSYSFYTKRSEAMFGCFRVLDSKYCINAYNCWRVNSLFECDFIKDSTTSYFCHNCENVHESMFCSNVKNLRYAVGNVVVGREKYLETKRILLDYVLGELEKKKSVDLDIFNVGAL